MPHKHSIYDTDPHFTINPLTRKIVNQTAGKTKIMQFDHNSERFTFELPRLVDGHDMSLCDKVEIHYINVSANGGQQNADIYPVSDVAVNKEADAVYFSWLISQNATQIVGSLNFMISFKCLDGDNITYRWNTDIFKDISISDGMNNSEGVISECSDVFEAWKAEVLSEVTELEEAAARAEESAQTHAAAAYGEAERAKSYAHEASQSAKEASDAVSGFDARVAEKIEEANAALDTATASKIAEATTALDEVTAEKISEIEEKASSATGVSIVQETGDSETAVMSQKAVTQKFAEIDNGGGGNVEIVQTTGDSETAVMSQKAVTEKLAQRTEYGEIEEDITSTLTIEDGYHYTTGLKKASRGDYFGCTGLISVKVGDKFKITATYGYDTTLIAEFDSNQTMVSYNGKASGSKVATDYEYTVPENISYIAISNRDQRYDGNHNLIKVIRVFTDDVKRHIENLGKSVDALSNLSLIATNQIADKSKWTATGGALTFDGDTAVVTASKSNVKIGINAAFGKYNKGDTIFFKMNIKAPFGVGGTDSQNAPLHNSYINSSTGMKYVRQCGVTSVEATDYYANITFDGEPNANSLVCIIQYNSVNVIPDNAQIKIKNIVAVNLTKVFGAGNEPTAEEFYSLLDGFENKFFEGEVNLFGTGANLRRIYNEYKSSLLTKNITITVGEGGDFETLNAAISYLSSFYPAYKKGGIKAYINILAGTVINEQIYANQIDLQYITIVAEAGSDNTETINIDGTNHTMVIVPVNAAGFGNTANAHDARGNYPFIAGENAAKLPTIGCVFRLMPETVESGKSVCGMLCNRGSEGVVLAASGFDGFNDGVIANNESSITIREGISRNMTRWGVHARHNGEVSARSCICTNCGIGACADRVADLDVREAVLDGSTVAIECNNISRANANGCHARNCGSENGYVVMVSGGGIVNCGSLEATGSVGTVYNISTNTLTANGIIFA